MQIWRAGNSDYKRKTKIKEDFGFGQKSLELRGQNSKLQLKVKN